MSATKSVEVPGAQPASEHTADFSAVKIVDPSVEEKNCCIHGGCIQQTTIPNVACCQGKKLDHIFGEATFDKTEPIVVRLLRKIIDLFYTKEQAEAKFIPQIFACLAELHPGLTYLCFMEWRKEFTTNGHLRYLFRTCNWSTPLLLTAAPTVLSGLVFMMLIDFGRQHYYLVAGATVTTFVCAWVATFVLLFVRASRGSSFPDSVLRLFNAGLDVKNSSRKDDTAVNSQPGMIENRHQDLTTEELELLEFFTNITVGWQRDSDVRKQMHGIWGMSGFKSFNSIRYHLAFVGYAVSLICAKNPAYIGRTKKILNSVIKHILHESVWRDIHDHYWYNIANPLENPENIMWTGHVGELCALYESLTGDKKFSKPGGIQVTRTRDRKNKLLLCPVTQSSSLPQICRRYQNSMQNNPSHGIPCEPSLVFFQCNTHPHIALRMVEKMHGKEDQWLAERRRWEDYALHNMCATTGPGLNCGAFRVYVKSDMNSSAVDVTLPAGHLGSDGWNLTHYFPWTISSEIPKTIWYECCKPIFDEYEAFDLPTKPFTDAKGPVPVSPEHGGAHPPNDCCGTLNIPNSALACSLLGAVAQAEDFKGYDRLYGWVKEHYFHSENGMSWISESADFMIGNTAQFAMGVALRHNPTLYREIVQEPLPGTFFQKSVMLEEAYWNGNANQSAKVVSCYCEVFEEKGIRILHLKSVFPLKSSDPAAVLFVQLSNVGTVQDVLLDNARMFNPSPFFSAGDGLYQLENLTPKDDGIVSIKIMCSE